MVGINLRHQDQLKPDVVRDVLGKAIQNNARFCLSDHLKAHLYHLRVAAGNDKMLERRRVALCINECCQEECFVVKAAFFCLAHALIFAMARVNGGAK